MHDLVSHPSPSSIRGKEKVSSLPPPPPPPPSPLSPSPIRGEETVSSAPSPHSLSPIRGEVMLSSAPPPPLPSLPAQFGEKRRCLKTQDFQMSLSSRGSQSLLRIQSAHISKFTQVAQRRGTLASKRANTDCLWTWWGFYLCT